MNEDISMQVPPHNFTHSPVEEVLCSFCLENNDRTEIIILPPYPGWTAIRERITQSLKEIPGERVFSCHLRYTDSFPLSEGEAAGNHITLAPLISGELQHRVVKGSVSEIVVNGSKTGTEIAIQFEEKGDRMMLIFEATCGKDLVMNRDSSLLWFDSARSDIHLLFDIIVSDELRKRIM